MVSWAPQRLKAKREIDALFKIIEPINWLKTASDTTPRWTWSLCAYVESMKSRNLENPSKRWKFLLMCAKPIFYLHKWRVTNLQPYQSELQYLFIWDTCDKGSKRLAQIDIIVCICIYHWINLVLCKLYAIFMVSDTQHTYFRVARSVLVLNLWVWK